MKIAVVGGGIAGIMAAHLLAKRHEVTVFEKESWLGGHTNTITLDRGPDKGLCVDTGFIVCNPTNYPLFYEFLKELEVPTQDSDMTFCYSSRESGFTYNGPTLAAFLLEPLNLFNPRFLRMLVEQRHFNRSAQLDLENRSIGEISLADYCRRLKLSDFFMQSYLTPLTASIWSSPDVSIQDFPALTFITFFNNHGMLDFSKLPQWQTIKGGSQSYVRAFLRSFSGQVHLNSPVLQIERSNTGVTLTLSGNARAQFDKVVLATHADVSLRMLVNPSPAEVRFLGAWKYSTNHAALHSDPSLMPKKRKLWGSWNYVHVNDTRASDPVCITYYMNRLQELHAKQDYFVSLNARELIAPESILYEVDYTHPVYTPDSVGSQHEIRMINGQQHTYYCGAHLGYGFHEDAVVSAHEAVARLEGR